MGKTLTRRQWLRRAAGLAGAAVGAGAAGRLTILAAGSPNAKLGTVLVGCGGRGTTAHLPTAAAERLVALVDCDETKSASALKWITDNAAKFHLADFNPASVRHFADYREMFDKIHRDVDAVFIATPDHQHACPAMMAIKLGKHVYCEKPLTHDIGEARALAEAARNAPKVATQMGNQGLASGGDQALAEYLAAGAIGKLIEVHSWHGWSGRFGGSRPRPPALPVPQGMHWDEWIGPAPFRDYHAGLHPSAWHGWWDFGTGSLGGWGTHVLDAVYFALKLGPPASVEAVEMDDPSDDRFPARTVLRFDFPARGDQPPAKVFWYDGSRQRAIEATAENEDPKIALLNRPRLASELERRYGRPLGPAASLFVGEKGIIHAASHGGAPRIIPEEQHRAFPVPARTLPRQRGGILGDFLRACKEGGAPPCSNFADFAGPFIEAIYVGLLAMKAGVGRKVEWDSPSLRCTNLPELNRWVRRDYRKGWVL